MQCFFMSCNAMRFHCVFALLQNSSKKQKRSCKTWRLCICCVMENKEINKSHSAETCDVKERKDLQWKKTQLHVSETCKKRSDSSHWPNDPLHTDCLRLLPCCSEQTNYPRPGLSARSEVEPDTGARSATVLGPLGLAVQRTDVCSGAVIIATATEEQRRGPSDGCR